MSFIEKLTGARKKTPKKKKKEEQKPARLSLDSFKPKNKTKKKKKTKVVEGRLGVDLWETNDELVLKAAIAGVAPDKLDISITSEMVTIKGERQTGEKITSDSYLYQECYWGSFSRSMALPVEIIADESDAAMKDGILTIRMPKAKKTEHKKLKIRLG